MRCPPPSACAALVLLAALAASGAAEVAGAADISYALIERGRALVDAGDCAACHTETKDRPFAGGRAIPTPFGTIFSANITPDRDTGIGAWSEDDFYRAMHEGRGPHGERLYPAFPYPYFTRMPRADVNAVRAFLMTLKPMHNAPPRNRLTWPLNFRTFMAGWNMLFFTPGEFAPDPRRSAEWNRGAYLVQGPGHCGACHTGKNLFGADTGTPLAGAQIQDWTAPSLRGEDRNGLGRWSADDIVEYLKTGRNRFSGATGLMGEVVLNSTSKMAEQDLKAIATYLKDLSGNANPATPATPTTAMMDAGEAIYADTCAACHQASGEGVPHLFPPLKGNAVAQQADPTTVVRVILEGALTAPTAARPTPSAMPAFDWKLTNEEVAAVATYVRNAWGNKAAAVTADKVAAMRRAVSASKAAPHLAGSGVKLP